MFKFVMKYFIEKFGKHYNYDVEYMLHMLKETPDIMKDFNALSKLSGYRKTASVNAHMAAKLCAVVYEDCGPCVQLSVDMAREAGMAEDQIEAVLTGNQSAMAVNTNIGYRFAKALLHHSEDIYAARDAIRKSFGEAAVIELTLATQIVRLFPQMKTGLGYGQACSRINLGEKSITVIKEAA